MNRSLQHPVASISRSAQKKEFLLNACAINAISLPFSTLAKHFFVAHTRTLQKLKLMENHGLLIAKFFEL